MCGSPAGHRGRLGCCHLGFFVCDLVVFYEGFYLLSLAFFLSCFWICFFLYRELIPEIL